MTLVPKKNIDKLLFDVKQSDKNFGRKTSQPAGFVISLKKPEKRQSRIKYILSFGLIAVIIALGSIVIFAKTAFNGYLDYAVFQIQNIKGAFSEMKTGQLKISLQDLSNEIKNLELKSENLGVMDLLSLIGKFNSSLKEVPGAFKNISAISEKASQIADDIDYLKNNALQFIFNQKGEELITRLDSLENNLFSLENLSSDFKNQAIKIKKINSKLASIYDVFDKNYLAISLNIYKSQKIVSALSSLLKSPDNVNVLLLFQNPTEIRPGGGFLGSFGYITLNKGSIKEIKIDDIYNADRQLDVKISAPRELTGITTEWGARDANWFFNFPDSAKKVAYFLENSKLFSNSQTEFKNVISINTNILKSLIEITGPIELPAYNLTIDSNNFLPELQREVEAGQDKKPGQNPKKILSVLTPILIDKLKNLDDAGKIKLIEVLKEASVNKDIMAFSEDENLQKVFLELGLAGQLFTIPNNFNGDYLAIANGNVGGGKSDAFIDQQIKLKSQILDNGAIADELTMTRMHSGQNEKDWWYKATNKDYAKIFIPENSEVSDAIGANSSPYSTQTKPAVGFKTDPDLEAIEKKSVFNKNLKIWEGVENNRKYVGAWIITSAGKTNTFTLNYQQNKKIEIQNNSEFTFIFDKQSGQEGSLEYEITAPANYIWQESGDSVFNYSTQQIKSREIIRLTLKKI
jgi:hypothetical protein